jgi:hypothetical protein
MTARNIIKILTLITILSVGYFIYNHKKTQRLAQIEIDKNTIDSYEDCVDQGFFPTKLTYPPTCTTNTGQTFTQDIGNELDKKDLVKVSSPRPGQKITSPLSISGSARGNWFSKGNLPIKLIDANGKTIASTTAESLGDWMTNDFVDFTAVIKFKPPYGSGKLIIQKSNPSNLPENSDQLEIPIRFEF